MRRAWLLGLAAIAVAPAALTGCGYMIGVPRPANVRTIRIELAENHSNRRDADLLLTEALGPELEAVGFAPAFSGADAVLHVRLIDVVERTINADSFDNPREGTITVAADVVLKAPDGRVILDRRGIRETDTYVASRGEGESGALARALQTLARRIADSLQSDF